ncbi:uncharacterized protein LOC106774721 [Vigna radiata var. radiata]|uniref:Uncharacterized protein LOC106774721 n=1 Tax=Vigna radiata var. radiata TaxID=3916 RepID=A0A1S3VGK5_VIGRR|nr:uncharacterized protein LOC106774721 [Vigna radiata var. radiata]
MESETLQQTNSAIIRRRPHIRVPGMNVTRLIRLGKQLKTMKREAFRRKYGNLFSLMEVDVPSLAITTLSQYYDSPLSWFTFQDFQLAPTLEEFEHILGSPLEGTTPYQHLEHHASITIIAAIMKLLPRELKDRLVAKNHVRGLTLEYLEQYLHHMADSEEWETFMDMLALTLYDIMLFPKIEDFVDYGAIDAFVAKKTRAENPVIAILADGTVDKNMGTEEWAHFFAGLNGGKIKWRPSWLRDRGFIHYCGNFPNIPLIGARYCINYNPTLVQRQFRHPMRGAPSSDYLTPLFIYCEDGGFTEKVREIRRAWGNVVRFKADERTKVINQEVNYHNWIAQRLKDIKLPFKSITGQLADERKFLNP